MKLKVQFNCLKTLDGYVSPRKVIDIECLPPIGSHMWFPIEVWETDLHGSVDSISWEESGTDAGYLCHLTVDEPDLSDTATSDAKDDLVGWIL